MSSAQPYQASLRFNLAFKQVEILLQHLAKLSAGVSEYQDEPCPAYLVECQDAALQVLSTAVDIALLLGVPIEDLHNATK